MKEWFEETLFDWLYTLLYGLLEGLLRLVKLIESFFDIFAGTAKVTYKGSSQFLINVFFSNSAITNAFWGMTLIAMVLAFMFCIYGVAKNATDVTGSVKQTVGQVMSNFFRSMLTLVMLNAMLVAGMNIGTTLLDRINYVMVNASILHQDDGDREFTDEEYATMARVLATVGNYSINPSSTSRYNINSCFNAIRGDLYALDSAGIFEYDYDEDSYCWQSALALLANSADLTKELSLDTYNSEVAKAYETVVYQLTYNPDFKPVQSAPSFMSAASGDSLHTDVLVFLITTMEAANNSKYNGGEIYDSLRSGYLNGTKSYTDMDQVRKDFDIWEIDYVVGYIVCIVFILIMAICIFTLIVRIFNLMLLYVIAPLFVSSMPLDEGQKFQNWIQSFIIQMCSGMGMVVSMRLYLIMIPVIISSDLVFFSGSGVWYSFLNMMARVLMILGGAWAVLKSSSLVAGILTGMPDTSQEGKIASQVTRGAQRAVMDTAKLGVTLGKAAVKAPVAIGAAPAKLASAVSDYFHAVPDAYHAVGDKHRQRKNQKADRQAQKERNKAGTQGTGSERSRNSGSSDKQASQPPKAPVAPNGSGTAAQQTESTSASTGSSGSVRSRSSKSSDSASQSSESSSASTGSSSSARSRGSEGSDSASQSSESSSASTGSSGSARSRSSGGSDSASQSSESSSASTGSSGSESSSISSRSRGSEAPAQNQEEPAGEKNNEAAKP